MSRSEPKIIDVEDLLVSIETSKAYLVTDGIKNAWLPKSLVDRNEDGTFTMPEWLAIEKGLV